MKSEKGSITLFVLIAMIFFLTIAFTAYASASSKLQGQNSELERIKANYGQDLTEEGLASLYDDLITDKQSTRTHTITFVANGGTISEETRVVAEGAEIGTLPSGTKDNYDYVEWYTENDEQVTANTIMGAEDVTYYARWVIDINESKNISLQEAIEEVSKDNKQVEIKIDKAITENLKIESNQNIILNMQGRTLEPKLTSNINVVNNSGTLEIKDGNLEGNTSWAIIDNKEGGTLIIKDTKIISTYKQAICNLGGTVYIEGNSYIKAPDYTIDNQKGGRTCDYYWWRN